MPSFKDTGAMKAQYATAETLEIRILLHELFSTNKQGWTRWVFENYQLATGRKILELGCGNAVIWKNNAQRIPSGICVTLSDFSQGMLDQARENTAALDFADYQIIDAQEIPFPDGSFDAIIANHMLYHVPDLDRALSEISRVLSPDGVLYATTIGQNNFKEMIQILQGFDERIVFPQDAVADAFGLETGEAKLARYFGAVETRRYEDSLHITQAQPLIDYVLSARGIGNANQIITGDAIVRFGEYIHALLKKDASIDIQKDAGMLIAKSPRR